MIEDNDFDVLRIRSIDDDDDGGAIVYVYKCVPDVCEPVRNKIAAKMLNLFHFTPTITATTKMPSANERLI